MRRCGVALCALLLLLRLEDTHAQAPAQLVNPAPALAFRTLTTTNGLAENSVYAIVQDRRGFLWVATQDGLSRYDGVGFRTFRNDARRPSSLGSNYVLSLCQDSAGNLWAGTGGGLSCYNPRTNRFFTYRGGSTDSSGLTDNYVRTLLCDRQGRVWAGTETALHRFNPATKRFTAFQHLASQASSIRFNAVRTLAQDQAGTVWVGTGEGRVSRLDTVRGQLVVDTRLQPAGDITALRADRLGGLWVGSSKGVLRYLPAGNGPVRSFKFNRKQLGSLPGGSIKTLFEDRSGTLWVGTTGGLCRYQPATGTFSCVQHQPGNPNSLPENTVQALGQDRSGLLWVGTEAGLSCTNLRPNAFGTLDIGAAGPVWAVTSDKKGMVWVGTEENGLLCYDPATGQRRQFRHDPASPGSVAQNYIRALRFDSRGRLWVGTQDQGLDCLEPGSSRFVHYRHNPADPGTIADDMILSVYEDAQGKLWVGTNGGGLSLFNPNTKRFTTFRHDPKNPNSLPNNYVRTTFQDRQGRIWMATGGGGLARFDARSGRFTTFRADGRDPRSLNSNSVRCMLQDKQGTLWVGTEGGGFSRVDDPDAGRFTTFREAQGLPNDVVYGIQEDLQGHLWVATNKGLARFAPTTQQFLTFDERDGLLQNEFNAAACHRTAAGLFYFGGVNGVVTFQPGAIHTNPIPPPVVLTGFRKFNRLVELPDTVITERRVLRLSPQDNVFSLEFAALNFQLPEKNRYAYQLQGFDEQWVPAGNRREATYTNLDPGPYTFRVVATNNDGIWNSRGVSLTIVVDPPWHRTWWFQVGISWVIFGLLFLAYRIRVGQLLTLERVRHGIARDLHDDMGSTLSSISILSQIARNHQRQQRPELAAAVLEQIGDSSRRMLDTMDDIVWAINPAHDSLDDVTARMRRFASEVLEARGIEFTFRADSSVQGLRLGMHARREFFLLFKEAVNNLAKYAECQHADILLAYHHGQLQLTVQDDGVGFDLNSPAQGGGNGLTNMYTRAAALSGKLTIDTAPGQGTILHLTMPLEA